MRVLYLQSILKELVHLGHLGCDGQIDGTVGNLDDESTLDLRVDLGNDLELLAGGDVVRLVDGRLETAEGSVVEGLYLVSNCSHSVSHFCDLGRLPPMSSRLTYRGAGNSQLNLPPVRTHEHTELLYNTL
jgi:hypothetical protein